MEKLVDTEVNTLKVKGNTDRLKQVAISEESKSFGDMT